MSYPFKNMVFEGGGVKGIAYVGVMEVLEQKGMLNQIKRVGGTSAGAINAFLFAAGYDVTETQDVMQKLDFNKFKDDSWGVIRDSNRLINEFGLYKGNYFKSWLKELLERKGISRNITFKSLHDKTGKELFVYATNLSTNFGEIYSPEHTPRMRVVDAVRRSMSIPLFFKAIRDDREDVFVDGGVINNYPIKLFDREKYINNRDLLRIPSYYARENQKLIDDGINISPYMFNKETLGFRLDSKKEIAIFRDGDEPQSKNIENFIDYTWQMISTILSVQDSQHLHSDDWQRTVYVDTLGVGTTDFDISDEKKCALIESGRFAAERYFKWWENEETDLAINHPNSTA
jgi:NTE family protein